MQKRVKFSPVFAPIWGKTGRRLGKNTGNRVRKLVGNPPGKPTPSSESFLGLTEFRGANSVSCFQSIMVCQSELTEFFAELTEFAVELSEAQ